MAEDIARYIDKGGTVLAGVAEVTGGTAERPTYGVNIELPKA